MKPFIEYLRAQLGNIYAWGGQGDNLSGLHDPIKWIKGQEDDAENRQRVINFYKKRKAEGQYPIKAFDCSGLIMYFLDDLHGVMDDKSAQMLYQKCKKIKKDELQEGDLVFKGSSADNITHVGVYVGGGKVIESKGRDDGVVETNLAERPFKYFGRLAALEPFLVDEPDEPYIFRLTSPRQKGPEVLELQRFLNFCHYRDENGDALDEDGIYGKHTDRALLGFAAWYGFIEPNEPTPHTVTINSEPFTVIIDGETVLKAPGGDDV